MVITVDLPGGGVEEVQVQDEGFTIETDAGPKSPAVATEIETESDGKQETITDQCGNTQRYTATLKPEVLTVSGIVTKTGGATTLTLLGLQNLEIGTEYDIECDIFGGKMELSNKVITQSSGINFWKGQDMSDKRKAFEFQMQFGERRSASD